MRFAVLRGKCLEYCGMGDVEAEKDEILPMGYSTNKRSKEKRRKRERKKRGGFRRFGNVALF